MPAPDPSTDIAAAFAGASAAAAARGSDAASSGHPGASDHAGHGSHGPHRPETIAVHAGLTVDAGTGAVTPPIHPATTFERAEDGTLPHGFVYGRENNPTRAMLERALCELEGADEAAAFGSGIAACAAVLQSLDPGDEVLLPTDRYFGIDGLQDAMLHRWGLQFREIDMTETQRVAEAIGPRTKLVWLESPSNPRVLVTDLAAVSALCRERGVRTVCDNTWCTPIVQRPLDLGVDLSLLSTTKYVSGHSDVIGGAVLWRHAASGATAEAEAFGARVRANQCFVGGVPSPFDCWLTMRGMRTLALRMRAHEASAMHLAQMLAGHSAVSAVHYPGLPSHPGHAVAAKQMRSFGGMLSFELAGGHAAAARVVAAVQLFRRATSLGGVESLIEHRAHAEGPGTRSPAGLIRVSAGIEHPEDLAADLRRALDAAGD